MNYPTVSDIKLSFKKADYNIIDCEVRTGKTYWAVNNLKQFSRDGMLNRILFLVDTNSRQMSWNKLKDYLPSIGYTVEKKRKILDGKQQIAYFITGE